MDVWSRDFEIVRMRLTVSVSVHLFTEPLLCPRHHVRIKRWVARIHRAQTPGEARDLKTADLKISGQMLTLSHSRVWLFVAPWTAACQAPLSVGFSRQEHWGRLPFPFAGHLPNPGIETASPASPAFAGRFFTVWAPGKPREALCVWVTQSCLTVCDLMGYNPPGSSDNWILQARIQKWVAISFSRGSSPARDWAQFSCTVGRFFTVWATREALWEAFCCRSATQ